MVPAARPAGSLRTSSRKISNRVGWPRAASAANACGAVIATVPNSGPAWPTTANEIVPIEPLSACEKHQPTAGLSQIYYINLEFSTYRPLREIDMRLIATAHGGGCC